MKRIEVLLSAMLIPFSLALLTGVLGLAYASLIPASILTYYIFSDPPSGFHVERSIERTQLTVGQKIRVHVKLTVENGSGLIFIGDVISPGLGVSGKNRRVFIKRPGKTLKVEYSYEVAPGKRGLHTISPIEVIGRDFLGILSSTYEVFDEEIRLEARPAVKDLKTHSLRKIRFGKHGLPVVVSRTGVAYQDFREIREYRLGDSLRDINWKATARLGTPLVNEYDPEGLATVMLYVDTTSDMGTGDVFNGALESAVSLAVSIIHALLRANFKVGLYLAGAGRIVPPRTGIQAFSSFIRAVLAAGPSTEIESMTLAIERSKHIGKVNLAIIITNTTPYNISEVRDAIKELKKAFNCPVWLVDINPYGTFGSFSLALSLLQKKKMTEKLGIPVIEWNTSRESLVTVLKKILGGVSIAL